jgi:hypothetical protein
LVSQRTRRSITRFFPRSELRAPLAAGVVTFAAAWAFVAFLPPLHVWLRGDVAFYENWGSWLASHRVPYRDFALEYPPGVLPLFDLPPYLRKIFHHHGTYDFWFRILLLAIGVVSIVAMAFVLDRVGASRRRAYAALVLAGIAPALLGPIALGRYDYWPALLAVAGVAALVSGRGVLACALFAAGAVAKVYPVLLVPLALLELWRRGRWRAAGYGVAVSLVVVAVGFGPYVALGPHGVGWSVHRQVARPMQVESLGSAVLVAAHELAGVQLHVVKGYGSDNLVGHWPDLLGTVSGVVTVLALLLVYALYARGPASSARLLAACAAAIVAYVAFAKVFSPQYLVWLFPLVPLVGGRAGLRANVLLAAAIGMTQIWEPYRYYDYYTTFAPWLAWLVVARDLLVVVLLVVLVRELWPSERHAQQLDPAGASVV